MITINLNKNTNLYALTDKLNEMLTSESFLKFIRDKSKQELDEITKLKLHDVEYEIASTYPASNKTKIGKDYIDLYNDSMVDLSEVSEKTLANYPDGLSMAKLVEYGTGVIGERSKASQYAGEDNWAYDINNHGDRGWYYQKDGMIYWSRGMEGKLIYHELKNRIEEKINGWIEEYLQKNLRM